MLLSENRDIPRLIQCSQRLHVQVNPRNRITVVRNIEKAVSGAVLVTATSFLVSSGALAEYVDPDDVRMNGFAQSSVCTLQVLLLELRRD